MPTIMGARSSEDDADGCVIVKDEAYKAGTVPGHPKSISDAFRVAVPPLLASLRRSPCKSPSDLPTATGSFISRLPPNLHPTLNFLLDSIIYPVYPISTLTRTSSNSCRHISPPSSSSAYRDHILTRTWFRSTLLSDLLPSTDSHVLAPIWTLARDLSLATKLHPFIVKLARHS